MAATVKRDRFPTRADFNPQSSRFIERVVVEGVTISSGNEQEFLFDVASATGMPALGSALDGHAEFLLRRILIESASNSLSDATAVAQLYWEADGFGGTPSVSVLTESSILTTRTTNLIPGTRIPMRIGKFTLDPTDLFAEFTQIAADNVTFSLMFPHRTVQVSSLMAGALPEDQGEKVGKANSPEWRGLGVGFWLISEHTTSVSKYTGYYQRRIAAISRVIEDWSETGILKDGGGRYVKVASGDITAINALPYSYGVILADDETGIGRWGPYQTTSFADFFGF